MPPRPLVALVVVLAGAIQSCAADEVERIERRAEVPAVKVSGVTVAGRIAHRLAADVFLVGAAEPDLLLVVSPHPDRVAVGDRVQFTGRVLDFERRSFSRTFDLTESDPAWAEFSGTSYLLASTVRRVELGTVGPAPRPVTVTNVTRRQSPEPRAVGQRSNG